MLQSHVPLNQVTNILLNLIIKVQYIFGNTHLKLHFHNEM